MNEKHQRICLVHYHEIGLKGHNRSKFEMRLLKNIEALLDGYPIVTIHRISGRLCVFLREGTDLETALEITNIILNVPGVARVSCGYKCERILEVMNKVAVSALSEVESFETFKVSARRNHTDFETNSMENEPDCRFRFMRSFPRKESQDEASGCNRGR